MFSFSMTRVKTSPPTPQPKQWNSCFSESTVNEGSFSEWNGQSPMCFRPLGLQGRVQRGDIDDV